MFALLTSFPPLSYRHTDQFGRLIFTCPYAAQSLIRYAEETALRKDERQIKYGLELRKKDAQINAIKSFNDFSKKIQPTSKNKPTDKLSDAERKIIKSLSK